MFIFSLFLLLGVVLMVPRNVYVDCNVVCLSACDP